MKNIFVKRNKKIFGKNGYSLPEVLVFIGIFSMILLVVVNSLITLTALFKEIRVSRSISKDASILLEKISYEVRNAQSVDEGASMLNSNPGVLVLTSNNGASTTEIYLQNGVAKLEKNNVFLGGITSSSTAISNLVFRLIDNGGVSDSVKTEVTLTATSSTKFLSKKFYLTTIMRGSY